MICFKSMFKALVIYWTLEFVLYAAIVLTATLMFSWATSI